MIEEKWSLCIEVKKGTDSCRAGITLEQWHQFAALVPDIVDAEDEGLHTPLLPSDDPGIDLMMDALLQIGVDVFGDHGLPEISIFKCHEYEPRDWCQAPFISSPRVSVGLGTALKSESCDARGILRLDGTLTPQARDFGVVGCRLANLMIVRRDALKAFHNSGLRGLSLPDVETVSKRQIHRDERVNAVWSSITMPPALNLYADSDQQICGRYEDLKERNIQGRLFNGYFLGFGELHYSAFEIEQLGGFDIGLVRESQFIAGQSPGTIIVSQKFRSFVREAFGLEVTGTPVRIQTDESIPWEGPYPSSLAHKNRRPKWLDQGLFSPGNGVSAKN